MHLTLKKEATRPPGFNSFLHEFNEERPHEALDMKCPADLYTASVRRYDGPPELIYRFHDRNVIVTACGLHRKRINTSPPCWRARSSASRRSTKAFGLPASCTMISDISTWSRKPRNLYNPFGTRLSPLS
jgi:hypothetical protein